MNPAVSKFGKIAFFLGSVGVLISLSVGQSAGFSTEQLIDNGVIGIILALSYFGTAYYRDSINKGKLTFGEGFKTSIFISLIGAFGVTLLFMIYTGLINTEYFEQYAQYGLQMAEENKDQLRIETLKKEILRFKDTPNSAFVMIGGLVKFFQTGVVALMFSLVIVMVLKRDKK